MVLLQDMVLSLQLAVLNTPFGHFYDGTKLLTTMLWSFRVILYSYDGKSVKTGKNPLHEAFTKR